MKEVHEKFNILYQEIDIRSCLIRLNSTLKRSQLIYSFVCDKIYIIKNKTDILTVHKETWIDINKKAGKLSYSSDIITNLYDNDYHEIYFNDIIEWMWEETVNELKITIAYNNILMLQDTLNLIVTKDIDFVISYMENAMWVKYCRQSHSCIFKTKTSSSIVKQPIKSELYKTLDCDKQNTSPEIDYLLSPNIFPYQRKADDGLSESNLYSL